MGASGFKFDFPSDFFLFWPMLLGCLRLAGWASDSPAHFAPAEVECHRASGAAPRQPRPPGGWDLARACQLGLGRREPEGPLASDSESGPAARTSRGSTRQALPHAAVQGTCGFLLGPRPVPSANDPPRKGPSDTKGRDLTAPAGSARLPEGPGPAHVPVLAARWRRTPRPLKRRVPSLSFPLPPLPVAGPVPPGPGPLPISGCQWPHPRWNFEPAATCR
jgi:hypothetical protein